MYRFETHLHTFPSSACGISTPAEMIDVAAEHGYSGIVVTNHFYHGNTGTDRNLPWSDFVYEYSRDYYEALEYGKTKGIKVFFGLEECYEAGKEILIYGLSPETIAEHPEFNQMNLEQKCDFVHSFGGLVTYAHPFRGRDYIPEPDKIPNPAVIDGVECYNYSNKPEDNIKAFIFARNNNLLMLSGGDVHHIKNFGNAGIAFKYEVKTYTDFINYIKSGDYQLLTPLNL